MWTQKFIETSWRVEIISLSQPLNRFAVCSRLLRGKLDTLSALGPGLFDSQVTVPASQSFQPPDGGPVPLLADSNGGLMRGAVLG
jgi:hypothetical protein